MLNTSTRVKICGLTRIEDLVACARYGADWVGFVFYEKSPRNITPYLVKKILEHVPNLKQKIVGLFVRPTHEEIAHVLKYVPLDILQIYDVETRLRDIKNSFSQSLWASCAVECKEDLPQKTMAQRLVVESAPPKGIQRPGGNGQRLDWTMLQGWKPHYPWILAGGLRPENVQKAIQISAAPAVDASSGVETSPGLKSAQLIKEFIEAAKHG